jgi:hypothetical protein
MWENDISIDIPAHFDPGKIVLFDYRDEGCREELVQYAEKLHLNDPRKLLLLSDHNDTGCLPLPPPKLIKPKSLKLLRNRHQDLFFCCSPTYLFTDNHIKAKYVVASQNRTLYNQRLEWAEKLHEKNLLSHQQGISRSDIEYLHESKIKELFKYSGPQVFVAPLPKEIFSTYLQDTKILLCPAGHSRWTYRHMEGFYNRNLVISCDLMDYKMLPQIPQAAYISVQDGDFKTDLINEVLKNLDSYQDAVDEGLEYAQQYYRPKSIFSRGGYRRKAEKKLFNDFMTYFS